MRGEFIVNSPLRVGAVAAPKNKVSNKTKRQQAGKARWIASLSLAAAVVVGVGAASAIFVDYLADRALARAVDSQPAAAKPIVAQAVDAKVADKVAALAPDEAQDSVPAVTPAQTEVVATLPDPSLVQKVAVGPEHAIELPGDDPTASPILQLDELAPTEDAFFVDVTVSNEELVTADVEDDGSADETRTAAIDLEADETPVKKPKRQKAANAKPAVEQEVEVASLPGVDVGGLASDDDNSGSTVRTVTKPARSTAKNLGGVAAGGARVTADVNLRSSPRKGSSIAGVVPTGSAVNVLSCNGWCEVVYNGKKGWVYKNFLASSKPVAKQQAAKPQKAANASSAAAPAARSTAPATRKLPSSRL